jgi:hypothetical protein
MTIAREIMRGALKMAALLPLAALVHGEAAAQGRVVFQGRAEGRGAAGGDVVFTAPAPVGRVGVIAVEPLESGRPVKGAPYMADAVTETLQVLSDGNRIERRTSASIARDSKGRVRREHQPITLGGYLAPRGPALTTIFDPSTGLHITLDHERRVAHIVSAGPPFEMALPPPSGAMEVGTVMYQADGLQAGIVQTDVRTTKLGERVIDGVRAEGTRTTLTIPAGTAGNQLPIEIVSERWYSPELQVVLQTERSDPRFGDTSYRLTNLLRAEPPMDLFEVPAGFRIEK